MAALSIPEMMTADTVRRMLGKLVADEGVVALAHRLRVDKADVSRMARGIREPTGRVLKALGLRRVVAYQRVKGKK